MGADKKPKGGGGGGYKWGSAMIWAGGQWAVCWFVDPEKFHLWAVVSACFSAFFSGWTTSAILGRCGKKYASAPRTPQHRINRRLDQFPHLRARAPAVPVGLLVLVARRGQAHVLVHVDDGHDLARAVAQVAAGPVEGPAGVEAHLAQLEGFLELSQPQGEQLLLDRLLALVADLQVAAHVDGVALGRERQRAHLH